MGPPTLFFSFKMTLAILSPFRFHMHFRKCFSISGKKNHHWGFDTDDIQSIDCFGLYGHLNNVKFSSVWTWMSLHLCILWFLSAKCSSFHCIRLTSLIRFIAKHLILFRCYYKNFLFRWFIASVFIFWKLLSRVWLLATPWAIQSMEFSRPEYWNG